MSKFYDEYKAWLAAYTGPLTDCSNAHCGNDDCAFGYFKRMKHAEEMDRLRAFAVCRRCKSPVQKTSVPGYFAYCPEHDEDLYQFETEGGF